jgi:hypothetical protein
VAKTNRAKRAPQAVSYAFCSQQVHLLGVEQRRMKAKAFALRFLVVTSVAVCVAWYAVASVQVGGIVPSDRSAADIIQQRCPLHLVRPEWIKGSDQGDILFSWVVTEANARLLAVCAVWVIANGVFALRVSRSPGHEDTA